MEKSCIVLDGLQPVNGKKEILSYLSRFDLYSIHQYSQHLKSVVRNRCVVTPENSIMSRFVMKMHLC